MVAITVILAAVIGTFVLGLGEQVEQNARAGVNADVDPSADEVTLSLTTLSNSDYVLVRGAGGFSNGVSGAVSGSTSSGDSVYLSQVGQNIVLNGSSGDSGTVTVVAVIGGAPSGVSSSAAITSNNPPDPATETTVQRVDYDF
jgi:FlaG/FlaF family flagellin (archaellin)